MPRRSSLASPAGAYAYFNHSYYCAAADPADVLAQTDYGMLIPAPSSAARLYAVQFHPEKSQQVGLSILKNFMLRLIKNENRILCEFSTDRS